MGVYEWAFWSITFFAILFTYSFQGPRKASLNYFSIELINVYCRSSVELSYDIFCLVLLAVLRPGPELDGKN